MPNTVTEAIVLKRINYGETDRILTLFTKDLGKISAIAKGVRKQGSRLAGHLEPGSIVQVELAQGKNLYILTGARIKYYYSYPNLSSMQALFTWLELIEAVGQHSEIAADLFVLAARGLEELNRSDDVPKTITLLELVLYSTIGYKLEAEHCVVGLEVLKSSQNSISLSAGGVVCAKHHSAPKDAFPVSTSAIKVLRLVNHQNFAILQSVYLPHAVGQELKKIVRVQRHQILEKELKSEILT